MKKVKQKKPSLKKVLFAYGIHFWILLFIVNVVIFYVAQYHAKGETCFSTTQVQSDNRCLYILNNKVYEKGSRNSPHQGHPCGTDVTSVVPNSHTSDTANFLDPNYVGDICANTTTSPTPTLSPTPQPSAVPSPQCLGGCISQAISPSPAASPPVASASPTLSKGSGGDKEGLLGSLFAIFAVMLKILAALFGVR